ERRRAGQGDRRAARGSPAAATSVPERPEKRPLRQLADALTAPPRHRLPALALGGGDAKKHLGGGAAPRRDGAAREAGVRAAVRAPGAPALDDRLAATPGSVAVVRALLGRGSAVPMGVTGTGGGAAGGHLQSPHAQDHLREFFFPQRAL